MLLCRQGESPVEPPKKHINMLSASVDVPWTPLLPNGTHTLSKPVYSGTWKLGHETHDKQEGTDMHTASSHTGVRINQRRRPAAEAKRTAHQCKGQRDQSGRWLGGVQWQPTQKNHSGIYLDNKEAHFCPPSSLSWTLGMLSSAS